MINDRIIRIGARSRKEIKREGPQITRNGDQNIMNETKELISKLNTMSGSHRAVLAITGGGTEAIGSLLRHGNGSNTILEAVVPYHQNAFNEFIKGKPDKYCSIEAARSLAVSAYIRATKLTGSYEVVGVGATSSLKKDESERIGRQHQIFVAFQNHYQTGSYAFDIVHEGKTSREEEETFAAHQIINVLITGFGYENTIGLLEKNLSCNCHCDVTTASPGWVDLMQDKRKLFSSMIAGDNKINKFIFPGAWNPMHSRHLEIAQKVFQLNHQRIDFELCIRNIDKPPISYYDMKIREEQIRNQVQTEPWAGNLHFTTAATFSEKAKLFPGCTFVVGMDTLLRIGDIKYYHNDEKMRFDAIEEIRKANCRFLVFHRVINGVATTEEDTFKVPANLRELTDLVSADILKPCDMSSSSIRKGL